MIALLTGTLLFGCKNKELEMLNKKIEMFQTQNLDLKEETMKQAMRAERAAADAMHAQGLAELERKQRLAIKAELDKCRAGK